MSVSWPGRIRQCCQCSYGQAFSGSMFRSELITLVQCDYVCVCLPFPGKTTMTGRRGLLHQSPSVCGATLTISPIQNVPPHGRSLTFAICLDQVPFLTNRNASTAGQLQVNASTTSNPVETKKKNELACVSEYKQIIRQTGLPANACHSLGLIGVLTTIQPYCLE